ncbi:hypothetical protein ORI89_06860 [Sphingobacterium sp. UT-1RO-CII-1]|uniref:hypothetical protein n=1 Tax=Sphingobacterium sp. UT-1RO-CII-1 TaxID=2995225 RepID=UPI00227BCF00|nr:hypothetical protein [Sphingobacterium sp. UT-1RO-CII-1]MCY4779363.1 hypothetical protein [Sphingobacterium sp. UT-1RO-CII-1]
MDKINRFSLYILNKVKFKRLVKGRSAYLFSIDIKKSEGYVAAIENKSTPYQYNSADYPLIADALVCELSDITPPDDWQVSNSHDKVDKAVVSLTDLAFAREVIAGIHASSKAYVLNDIKELLKHLALTSKNPEEVAVVTKVWEEFKK